jgi:hypothetical protein
MRKLSALALVVAGPVLWHLHARAHLPGADDLTCSKVSPDKGVRGYVDLGGNT